MWQLTPVYSPVRLTDNIHNKFVSCCRITALALLVCLPGLLVGQATQKKKTLVVNGRSAAGAVLQVDGHSYVDIETLAQMTNASLSIQPHRITLTMPVSNANLRSAKAANEMSKDFVRTGIAQLAEMREWKGAIAGVIRQGLPAGTWLGPFLQDYRSRAERSLEQTSVAATMGPDQQALQLLKNEFANLRAWDTQTQAAIQVLNAEQTVNPNAKQDDPLLAKISECGNFLNGMMVSREFADNASCH